jgi:beta-galactosidase/beta-glucuronidase
MADSKRILISNSFWKFRFGLHANDNGEDPGISNNWFEGLPPDQDLMKVYVPSSWSYFQNRKEFYHFGTGWYQTSVYLPLAWGAGDGKKISLVFNGANYKTTLWINGKEVGYHEGGYTQFWFEINEYVNFGKENLFVVRVDNRYQKNRLPWFGTPDWMNYGGIFRQVYLKLTSRVNLEDIKITNDIHFENPHGGGCEGCKVHLRAQLFIKNSRPYRKDFEGIVILSLKNGGEPQSTEVPVKIVDSGGEYIELTMELEDPHLWCPDNPFLYNLTFILLEKKTRRELDRETVRWGFRKFLIHDQHFYLNNKKIILQGINRHEDHPDVGSSLNPRLLYNDLNIMKEAHLNCIRTSHYPPHESLLELADEMGFLVLEEIPVYRLGREEYTNDYLMAAQKQLFEMIHRDKNHCSVIAWLISAECDLTIPEGYTFMKNLLDISRELDPFRYHSFVVDQPLKEIPKILDLVDFVATNVYVGWYDTYDVSPKEAIHVLDQIHTLMNDPSSDAPIKPLLIAEFGAGAVAGYKDFANSRWSENYQYDFLRTYLKMFQKLDYIAGVCIFHFQDFRISPHGSFLDRPKEYNNKGIVDMHRNPKIAYYIVQRQMEKWKNQIE